MWGTSVALPWKKQEGSMEIAWDEWHFNDTMMTRTPEEAVSRLLSSNFQSFKSYTVRFGIALIMEHGFWKTEKGQQQYALQLIQIRNAIAFTAQYGVTLALLNPPEYIDHNEKYTVKSSVRSKNQINNFFQDEIDEFAILNKAEDGFLVELGRLDEKLKRRNQVTGDMIIVPSGSARYVRGRPENRWHFLSGGVRKFDKSELSSGDGRMIVESIMHKMGEHQPSQDPTYREVVIGSFFHMLAHHLGSVSLEKFKTGMLDQLIYSEDKDDFYKMSYALNVRTLGLYDGWATSSKKGEMALTEHLGRKVFEGANTWGEVYQSAGLLEKLMKSINSKPEDVYLDFTRKFMAAEDAEMPDRAAVRAAADAARLAATTAVDPYDKYTERKEDNAEPGDDVSTALLQLHLKDLAETQHGHAQRLGVLYKWLKSLDEQAAKIGVQTSLHFFVLDFVNKNQEAATKGLRGEKATFAIYALAWEYAQNQLIAYGLEIATSANAHAASPFEKYITELANKKHYKCGYSGLTEKDLDQLAILNEQSPYWRPSGGKIAEIELVAPEPFAGNEYSNFKKLKSATHAFTLASSFLVLFNVPDATLQSLLNGGDVVFNFNELASNRTQLTERAGLLQFSVVMSALYALLVNKNPKSSADYVAVAKEWVKVANPVHALTGNSLEPTIEAARHLFTLDYQAPIDLLVATLRDALVSIYEARINGEVNIDKIVEQVRNVEFQLVHVQSFNHIRSAGAKDVTDLQGEAAGLFSIDEPLLLALHSHADYVATFSHERRDPSKRTTEDQQRSRTQKLKAPSKHLHTLIAKLRAVDPKSKAAKIQKFGEPVHTDSAGKHIDESGHWKATYIKLMGELPREVFENTYLPTNEYFVNYLDPVKADKASLMNAAVSKSSEEEILRILASLAGADPNDVTTRNNIEDELVKAHATLSTVLKSFKLDPQTLAQEWTRLWATKREAMTESCGLLVSNFALAPPAGHGHVPTEAETALLFQPLVTLSIMLSRYNYHLLREQVRSKIANVKDSKVNGTYSMLFLNQGDAAIKVTDFDDVVQDIATEHAATKQRISTDVLRNFLLTELSINDGYFWKWTIENDVIQAIGMLGFKPSMRYEAGTIIILSAWG